MKTISPEIKKQIFAQYLFFQRSIFDTELGKHKSIIELNPISNISSEDGIEVTKIVYGTVTPEQQIIITGGIKDFFEQGWNISLKNMAKVLQYLQSKGYALPYMDYSVEDLVELGVYKLKQ